MSRRASSSSPPRVVPLPPSTNPSATATVDNLLSKIAGLSYHGDPVRVKKKKKAPTKPPTTVKLSVTTSVADPNTFATTATNDANDNAGNDDGGSGDEEKKTAESNNQTPSPPISPDRPNPSTTPITTLAAPTTAFPIDILYEKHSHKPRKTLDVSAYANYIVDGAVDWDHDDLEEDPQEDSTDVTPRNTPVNSVHLLRTIAATTPNCHTLHLSFTNNLTTDQLRNLTTLFPLLTTLTLSHIPSLDPTCTHDLPYNTPRLHTLTLHAIPATNATLKHLPDLPLKHLTLDTLPKLTDAGLIYLTKSPTKLHTLSLINLPNPTDHSIIKLSEYTGASLHHLTLQNLPKLTPTSLTPLLQSLRLLTTTNLELPTLHDTVLENFANYPVVYGTKPHANMASMTILTLANLPVLTDAGLTTIWNACAKLKDVTLTNLVLCGGAVGRINGPLINLTMQGMPKATDESLVHFLEHKEKCKKLISLTLDLENITDEVVAAIALHCSRVTTLSISNNAFITGDAVASLLGSVGKLLDLSLTKCSKITDDVLFKASRKCLRLKVMEVGGCRLITNKGYKTVSSLKALTSVDLSNNNMVTDNVFRLIPGNCLTDLDVSYCGKITDEGLKSIVKWLMKLRTLKAKGCKMVTYSGVDVILQGTHISHFDVSKIFTPPLESTEALITLASKYPKHQYLAVDDAHVFTIPKTPNRHRMIQETHNKHLFCLLHSAKTVQRAWRELLVYRVEISDVKTRNMYKMMRAVVIQSTVRRRTAAKFVVTIRAAKTKVAVMLQSRFMYRHLLASNMKAMRFDDKRILRRAMRGLVHNHEYEVAEKARLLYIKQQEQACVHYLKTFTAKHFALWAIEFKKARHERLKDDFAKAHWGKHVIPDLFNIWRGKIAIRKQLRTNNAEVFIYVAHIDTLNSTRQKTKTALATSYHRMILLCTAWYGFRKFFEEFSETLQKAKKAGEHARAKFKAKMLTVVYKALRKYAKERIYKRVMRRKGEYWYLKRLKREAGKKLTANAKEQIKYRADLEKAVALFRGAIKSNSFKQLALYRLHRHRQDQRRDRGILHFSFRLLARFTARWQDRAEYLVVMKKKSVVARSHFNSKHARKHFVNWRDFTKHAGDDRAMLEAKAAALLKAQSFAVWKTWWREVSAAKRMSEDIEKQAEENAQGIFDAATGLQRLFRGWVSRTQVDRDRAFRDWAVLRCQAQFRVWHAKKVILRKRRWHYLQENLVEEKVEEEMDREEKYMRWWMKMEAHAITIKRILLGHRGRVLAYVRRQQRFRDTGTDFQVDKVKGLKYYKDQVQLRERQKVLRLYASVNIQKMYRGLLGRRRYDEILQDKKEREIASKVQSAFRGKQGRRRSDARRRFLANKERLKEARMIQAKGLRSMGFKQRSSQRTAIKVFRAMGLESMSFTQLWGQQFGEIATDYNDIKAHGRRYIQGWKEGKFDKYLRDKTRRRMLAEHEEGVTPVTSAAVRIIQNNNPYTGMTGQVIQIDRSFPNKAIAEVRMDVDGKVVYYQFITEPTMYDPAAPSMYRIEPLHSKGVPFEAAVRCKEFMLTWAAEERIKRKEYVASRTIQQLARSYTSKVRVAKLRYRHWSRLKANRMAVLHALNVYNSASIQSARVLLTTGFVKSSAVPILYEKPEFPPRIEEALAMRTLRNMLNNEFNARLVRRQAFCEVNEESMQTGTYRKRLRKFGVKRMATQNAVAYVKQHSTSVIAQQVADRGSGGGFVEKVAMFFGGAEWRRNDDERHAWMKRCTLLQMEQSPHARMKGLVLYHGVMKGNPLSKKKHPVVPHGEGYAEFLQGFGVGREEKTLHISILQARDLRAADFNNSDPFTDIECNRKHTKTKTILKTLDPVWNEHFTIDVSDPFHVVKIVVYDWDQWSSNDFLGQIIFPISDLADGKKIKKWYKLINQDTKKTDNSKKTKKQLDDENDLGDIEIEMQWTEREDSDDIDRRRLQHKNVIRVQSWARQFFARKNVRKMKERIQNQIRTLAASAMVLQCGYRCRYARKLLKTMKQQRKCVTKMQCCSRIWRAYRRSTKARLEYLAARSIQCCMRKTYSIMIKTELARIYGLYMSECACLIQRVARVGVAFAMMKKQRAKLPDNPKKADNLATIEEWLPTYGWDPTYRTKRLRRICVKTFARCLSKKGSIVVTPYGEAGLDAFPAPYLESREGEEFATVLLFGHRKLNLPKAERQLMKKISPMYFTAISLKDISIAKTVGLRIIEIQCMFRFALATGIVKEKRKIFNACVLVQRRYRWRWEKKAALGLMVQCCWRRYGAFMELQFKKKEVICARKIQGNFKVHLGRLELQERRRVSACKILDSSGDLNEMFDASRVLDGNPDTFWCSDPTNPVSTQWLSFDLQSKIDIGRVKLKTPNNTSSPKEVLVECANKVVGPWTPVKLCTFTQGTKKGGWQSVDIPETVARYWRLSIKKNYGNVQAVSIIGAGFFVATEITATVDEQPDSVMISPGPPVGRIGGEIVLKCSSHGWPPPDYQWTKNGRPIEGETSPTLTLVVGSTKHSIFKRFRCVHCKKINTELPMNIYRVICSNCKYPFDFDEVAMAAFLRKPLELEIGELELKLKTLQNQKNDFQDDVRALTNKIKRDKFAKDRGEEVKAEEEAVEEAAHISGLMMMEKSVELEQMSSIVTTKSSLEDDAMKHGLTIQKYKAMMKEFTTLEVIDDGDDGSIGSSFATMSVVKDGAATMDVAEAKGEIGGNVGEAKTAGEAKEVTQVGISGETKDGLPVSISFAPNAEGSEAVAALVVAEAKDDASHHSLDDDDDDDSRHSDRQQPVDMDDLSIGHLIGNFMENLEEEEVEVINPDVLKIEELEKDIKEINHKIETLEKKERWLLRKRLAAGEHDPCKVQYDGEGVYQCVVSNLRGGAKPVDRDVIYARGTIRHNKTRPAIIFVDDPSPQLIKVREEYHANGRLRRRWWPKYLSIYGWFVDGNICGDAIVRYHEGSVYDGPYVDERWLDYMGNTVHEAFESDHWGVWLTPDDVVFEGPSVDNHFDVTNVQGEFRVTYQNGEVYEGQYVDERRHGVGEYHYLDGSIYEGEWFKNKRQGFGVFSVSDGSIYEGEWDRDYIHGEGIWRWADGSSFMGDNIDGERTGRGVYITSHGDVYVGEFGGNHIHGMGTFTYNDGTIYEGKFRNNLREGDAVFSYPNGVKEIGEWRNDRRDGEFVVRRPVYADAADSIQGIRWDDETQHGIWDEGEFEEWVAPPVNPKATSEFIQLFKEHPDEYDGVYAMLIARKLPIVPHGIQESHPDVQVIIQRIAREGGQLVAFDSYSETKNALKEMEPSLNASKIEYRHYRKNEEHVDEVIAGLTRQMNDIQRKISALDGQVLTLETAIESFWLEDHSLSREGFDQACNNLKPLERNEWFQIRHYHEPPGLIENVMSAVCMLMLEKDNWKGAQNVLGSSVQNKDDGDAEAVWQEYDVKMLFLLEKFDVFERTNAPGLMAYVGHYLVDPRFKADNYFLGSFGPAAVKLVEWIWATYAYIKKSKEIHPKYITLMQVNGAIKRFRAGMDQLQEKVDKYESRASALRERVRLTNRRKDRWQMKYDKLEELLMKCQEMVTEYTSDDERELDEYEQMLLADGEAKATCETVIELMLQDVEDENEDPDVDEAGGENALFRIIDDAVTIGRKRMFRLGSYKYSGGNLVCERGVNIVEIQEKITKEAMSQINFVLNEYPEVMTWTMPDGEKVRLDTIGDVIRNRWTQLDIDEALNKAVQMWDTKFGKDASYYAVQSRTNPIMKENAKKEAEIWMSRHKEDVYLTETFMAQEFGEENHEETARVALDMKGDLKMGVEMMAASDVWCRMNRNLVLEELDRQNKERAQKFLEAHPDDVAKVALAFKAMTGDERVAVEEGELAEAESWIGLNLGLMIEEEDKEGARLAKLFVERYPSEEDMEEVSQSTGQDIESTYTTVVECVRVTSGGGAGGVDELKEARAWAAREENKDDFTQQISKRNKDEFHDDLVKATNVKGLLQDIKVWHTSLETRRKRLGLKTDAIKDEERKKREEADEAKRKKREAEDAAEADAKAKIMEEDEKKKKKDPKGKKKGEKEKLEDEKRKKDEAKAERTRLKEKNKQRTEEDEADAAAAGDVVKDEGCLTLEANITKARKKIADLCSERVVYNSKRLSMFEEKREFLERDKEYLTVPDKIRPSEAKIELEKSISLHNERLKFSVKAIEEEKAIVKCNEEELERIKADLWLRSGEEYVGAAAGGGEEWEQYWDESYQAWCWYNNVTGEVTQ